MSLKIIIDEMGNDKYSRMEKKLAELGRETGSKTYKPMRVTTVTEIKGTIYCGLTLTETKDSSLPSEEHKKNLRHFLDYLVELEA